MHFTLVLRVKRKSEPLALTVKADCFCMSTSVQVEKPDGGLREITPNHQDTLDFGKVNTRSHQRHKYSHAPSHAITVRVKFNHESPSCMCLYIHYL